MTPTEPGSPTPSGDGPTGPLLSPSDSDLNDLVITPASPEHTTVPEPSKVFSDSAPPKEWDISKPGKEPTLGATVSPTAAQPVNATPQTQDLPFSIPDALGTPQDTQGSAILGQSLDNPSPSTPAPTPTVSPDITSTTSPITPTTLSDVIAPATPTVSPTISPDLTPTNSSPVIGSTPADQLVQPGATPLTGGLSGGAVGLPSSPVVMKKKSRLKKMILPIILLFILAGGSAAAYVGYIVPNQPKNILQTALINSVSGKITSASVNASIAITVTDSSSKQNLNETVSGVVGQGGQADLTFSIDAIVTNFNIELLTPDGKNVYVKLSGLDGVPQLLDSIDQSDGGGGTAPQIAALVQSVNNQWYEVNQSLVSDLEKSLNVDTSTSATQTTPTQISDAYKKNDFLTVQKVLPAQSIGGQNSYHYTVVIDKTKLQSFVTAINSFHSGDLNLNKSQLNSFVSNLGQANLSKYPFDVWISKSSKVVDQVSFSSTSGGSPYTAKVTLSNINKPINVTAPANSKSVLDLLSQVDQALGVGSSGSSTPTNPLDMLNLDSGPSGLI